MTLALRAVEPGVVMAKAVAPTLSRIVRQFLMNMTSPVLVKEAEL